MRQSTLIFSLWVLGCAGLIGQTKQSGVGLCDQKPEVQQIVEVGDRPLHMVGIVKQVCRWTTPLEMAGLKAKDYTTIVTTEASGSGPLNSQDRGYVVVNMENGDKALIRFQGRGTVSVEGGQPGSGEGTWTYIGGTGKLTGLTGKGSYKGVTNKDHFEEDHVEGEWSIAGPKKK
jgi:hypothetical protein